MGGGGSGVCPGTTRTVSGRRGTWSLACGMASARCAASNSGRASEPCVCVCLGAWRASWRGLDWPTCVVRMCMSLCLFSVSSCLRSVCLFDQCVVYAGSLLESLSEETDSSDGAPTAADAVGDAPGAQNHREPPLRCLSWDPGGREFPLVRTDDLAGERRGRRGGE